MRRSSAGLEQLDRFRDRSASLGEDDRSTRWSRRARCALIAPASAGSRSMSRMSSSCEPTRADAVLGDEFTPLTIGCASWSTGLRPSGSGRRRMPTIPGSDAARRGRHPDPRPASAARTLERLLQAHRIRRVQADEISGCPRRGGGARGAGTVAAVIAHMRCCSARAVDACASQACARAERPPALARRPRGPLAAPPAAPMAPRSRRCLTIQDVAHLRSLPGVGIGVTSTSLPRPTPC